MPHAICWPLPASKFLLPPLWRSQPRESASCRRQALGLGGSGGIRDDLTLRGFEAYGSMWGLSQSLAHLWKPQPWLRVGILLPPPPPPPLPPSSART